MNDMLVIYVRPSTRKHLHLGPITAWIEGTKADGHGQTVWTAIEDLFTSRAAGKACRDLDAAVQAIELPESVAAVARPDGISNARPRARKDWCDV